MKGYNDVFTEKANMYCEHLRDGDMIEDSYMHDAVRYNNISALQILFQKSNINTSRKNVNGNTPLHVAALHGHCESIALLLEHEADPTMMNENNELPIHRAIARSQVGAVKLLATGSDLELESGDGCRCLHIAAIAGNLPIIQFLHSKGVDMCAVNKKEQTALHCAAISGDIPCAAYLITKCVSITAKDGDGRSAFRIAYKADMQAFLKQCEEVSEDPDKLTELCDEQMKI